VCAGANRAWGLPMCGNAPVAPGRSLEQHGGGAGVGGDPSAQETPRPQGSRGMDRLQASLGHPSPAYFCRHFNYAGR